jgi:hypothetical protein
MIIESQLVQVVWRQMATVERYPQPVYGPPKGGLDAIVSCANPQGSTKLITS